MGGNRDWPLSFREAANTLPGVVLPGVAETAKIDAVELLADTLRKTDQPVTIVTLGPLTNLGYAFDAEPALADQVRSIVTMGGAFDVAGNVFDAGEIAGASPDAEWNLYIDPESVAVVLNSGAAVTFVPLDATNFVPGNTGIFARLSATTATDSGEAVRQLWAASLGTERSIAAEWWYFWDELAAVIAVDPSVATITERTVTIDDSGVTTDHEDGTPALVASTADPDAFEQRFLETFAGGELPVIQLSSEDERYFATVRAAILDLVTEVDGAFIETETQADRVPADELAAQLTGQVFAAMDAFHQELSDARSPAGIQPQHDALLDAAATFAAQEGIYLETLAVAAPPEPVGVDEFFGIFFSAMDSAGITSPFDAFETACADLELAAYGLGATEGICLTDGSS
jgi:inosine-uridine nucleoside N-ribohydrolase